MLSLKSPHATSQNVIGVGAQARIYLELSRVMLALDLSQWYALYLGHLLYLFLNACG